MSSSFFVYGRDKLPFMLARRNLRGRMVFSWLTCLALTSCGAHRGRSSTAYAAPQSEVAFMVTGSAVGAEIAVTEDEGTESVADSSGRSFSKPISARANVQSDPTSGGGQEIAASPSQQEIVYESWLTIQVDQILKSVEAIRATTGRFAGLITEEVVEGSQSRGTATFTLRLPPSRLDEFIAFATKLGEPQNIRKLGTDVGKTLFDMEIALRNLEVTQDRLRKLLADSTGNLDQVLRLEGELTRIRQQIEQMKGQRQFLRDRVALATVHVTLVTESRPQFSPRQKLQIGPRTSVLMIPSNDAAEDFRFGGGVNFFFFRAFNLEVEGYADPGNEGSALLMTLGGGIYSDFMGFGQRTFLNPYLDFRLGWGRLFHESSFVVGSGIGLELLRTKWFFWDLNGRALGLLRKDDESEFGVQVGSSAAVSF